METLRGLGLARSVFGDRPIGATSDWGRRGLSDSWRFPRCTSSHLGRSGLGWIGLNVSPHEQTRRLESRVDAGRKIRKLPPMDIESYGRWYDFSRVRDEKLPRLIPSWRRGT